MSHLPVLIIVIPLLSAFIISLLDYVHRAVKPAVVLLASVMHAVAAVLLTVSVHSNGAAVYYLGGWLPPFGITLIADHASTVFILIAGIGNLTATLYRIGTDGLRDTSSKYSSLSQVYFCAMSGLAVAGDMFNLYVFVELATVASIGLIVLKRRMAGSVAGFVYIMVASISGILLLFAILLIYISTGSLNLAEIAASIHTMPPTLHTAATVSVVISFGIKFGMVPLHFWQPRAYHAAGSTLAGLLSGIGMKLYMFVLLRLLWIPLQAVELLPAIFPLLMAFGMTNILVGHLMGLIERDLKRMLAFSSIAHAGYILAGAAAAGMAAAGASTAEQAGRQFPLAEAAMAAALFHMLNHTVMKIALLWSGRRLIADSQSSRITQLGGTSRTAPLALTAFALASTAIIGLPPTAGFASKWYIATAQLHIIPIVIIAAGTMISLYYYGRILTICLNSSPVTPLLDEQSAEQPSRRWRLDSMLVLMLAVAVVFGGLGESHLFRWLHAAAGSLMNAEAYIQAVLPGGAL